MTENLRPPDSISGTDLKLLAETQEYLRSILQKTRPNSLLTSAWDEFYRVYDRLMRRFALARGVQPHDVDDCLQQVWLEVSTRLVRFEHPETRPGLRSWLYVVVRSKASDLLRNRRLRSMKPLDHLQETAEEPRHATADPGEVLDSQWERSLLETFMEEQRTQLSETNWRLLQMRCLEGRPVPEVASELGLTSEQVWYRQHRLMKKLKTAISVFTGQRSDESS